VVDAVVPQDLDGSLALFWELGSDAHVFRAPDDGGRGGAMVLLSTEGHSMIEMGAELSPSSDKRSVLVVEDEVLQRMMLADDLAEAGFHVVQAANAAEALDVLQSGVSLDLVIIDVRMPGGIDGLELAVQARVIAPHLKIIVVSGHLLGLPDRAVADALVAKPYAPSAILDCVTRLLTMGEQWQDPK
jgi:CheY-like chemotaxis protein